MRRLGGANGCIACGKVRRRALGGSYARTDRYILVGRKQYVKGIRSGEHESYDQRRFVDALLRVRRLLIEIESKCPNDEILRDTLSVMLETHGDQLSAVARACDRSAREAIKKTVAAVEERDRPDRNRPSD